MLFHGSYWVIFSFQYIWKERVGERDRERAREEMDTG